ncbi:MAG: HD domain-containing protein [Eubacterium sp.]
MARKNKSEYSKNKYIAFTDVARLINIRLEEIPILYGSLGVEIRVKKDMKCQDINVLLSKEIISERWNDLVDIMSTAGFVLKNRDRHIFDREGIEFTFTNKDEFNHYSGIDIDAFEKINDFAEYYLPKVSDFLALYGFENKDNKCVLALNEYVENEVTKNVKRFARKKYDNDNYCKNYYHSLRIYNLATKIAKNEGLSSYIIGLSAWLHYAKMNNIDFHQLLADNGVTQRIETEINNIISCASGKNAPKKAEAKCLYDSLIIDKLGAVGIAGAFAHDAIKGITMYNTEITPNSIETEKDYQNYTYNTIDYFHTVLMQLESRVKTNYGKSLAKERTEFMQRFLYEFYDEWEGII